MMLLAGIATPILIGSRLGFGRGLFELVISHESDPDPFHDPQRRF